MKKIIFLPTYRYLSDPIFENLYLQLKYENYLIYYIDTFLFHKEKEYKNKMFDDYYSIKWEVEENLFKKYLFKYKRYKNFKEKLIEIVQKINPTAIISTSDMGIDFRILKYFFKNIPFFVIQSAWFIKKNYRYNNSYFINFLLREPLFNRQKVYMNEYKDTYLLLWGEYFEKYIDRKDKNNICVCGNIELDTLLNKQKSLNDGINNKKVLVTLPVIDEAFSNPNEVLIMIEKLVKTNKNIIFYFNEHPRDNNSFYKHISKNKNVILFNRDSNWKYYIKEFDLHIFSNSTSLVYSLYFKKPIINILDRNNASFLRNDFDEEVFSYEELDIKFKNKLKQNKIENIHKIEKYIKLDDKSAFRAVKYINNIIKKYY